MPMVNYKSVVVLLPKMFFGRKQVTNIVVNLFHLLKVHFIYDTDT